MRAQTGTDELIAGLAERQHGVVTRAQLLELGIGRRAIGHRIQRCRLHVIHRGVYAVGRPSLTCEGRWMAAALAVGGAISHRAAACAWDVWSSPLLEVTASRPRRRPGIRVYCSQLPPDEVTVLNGIPITTVARTFLDLATVLPVRHVERALHEAEVRRLQGRLQLPSLLQRYPRRSGTPLVRAILDGGEGITRSTLESSFADFVSAWGLLPPARNARIPAGNCWFECDCVWRDQRLIVELDGRAFHGTARAFERDRARDRRLSAAGWRVIRVTWRQLRDEPEAVATDVRAALNVGG
jgi:REase_MTES_1575/Transcriptional regulator, AbiEi antitoxin